MTPLVPCLLLVLLAGCAYGQNAARAPESAKTPEPAKSPESVKSPGGIRASGIARTTGTITPTNLEGFTQEGVASYYAEEFHGRRTANGETYSMWAMTAAHQTLPFNSLVRVTNLENGKNIVVRINDAGPFKDNRIIDLTRAGAAKLGMIEQGTARVRLELVGRDEDAETNVSDNEYYEISAVKTHLSGFGIQVGSFEDMDHLLRQLDVLAAKGLKGMLVQLAKSKGGVLHRVVIGGFATRADAEKRLASLRKAGISGFVFQVR